MMNGVHELSLPLISSHLHFDEVIIATQVSRVWRDSLYSRVHQVHLHCADDSPVTQRRRQRFLKYFQCIRNLSAMNMNWCDAWVRANGPLFQHLTVLSIDRLSFTPAPHSDEPLPPLVLNNASSKLNQLFLSHYGHNPANLFQHLLTPCHPLTYLLLDHIQFLSNADVSLIFERYPHLKGLHVTGSFALTAVAVPQACAKQLNELTLAKCPHLTTLRLPAGSLLAYVDLSFTSVGPAVVTEIASSAHHLHVLNICQCLQLTHLILNSTSLSSLPAMNCTQLTHLTLHCSNLKFLKIMNNFALRYLALSSYCLKSLDLSMLKELRTVELSCPKLKKLLLCGCSSVFKDDLLDSESSDDGLLGIAPVRVISNEQLIFNQLDKLFINCPSLDVQRLLDWGIAGTVLFAMKDELYQVYFQCDDGKYRSKHHCQTEVMHSPQRIGDVRKRNSFA